MPVILEAVPPSAAFVWSDDNGVQMRGLSPFPGSTLLSISGMDMAAGGQSAMATMAVGTLLPALGAASRNAQALQSASVLRQVCMGLMIYAEDNGGKFPDDLGQLTHDEILTAEIFVHPRSSESVPHDIRLWPKQRQRVWVNQVGDYVYVAPRLDIRTIRNSHNTIVAFEALQFHYRGQVNAAFADGHVELVPLERVERHLE